jgi:hypothetical protein
MYPITPLSLASVVSYGLTFFILTLIFSKIINKIFPMYDDVEKVSKLQVSIELLVQISLIVIFIYILEYIVEFLYSKVKFFHTKNTHEVGLTAMAIISSTLYISQHALGQKINYLLN